MCAFSFAIEADELDELAWFDRRLTVGRLKADSRSKGLVPGIHRKATILLRSIQLHMILTNTKAAGVEQRTVVYRGTI